MTPTEIIAGQLARRQLSNSAEGIALDLQAVGLLAGGWASFPNPVQAAANVLGCRMSWPDAAAVAEALDDVDLLVAPSLEG